MPRFHVRVTAPTLSHPWLVYDARPPQDSKRFHTGRYAREPAAHSAKLPARPREKSPAQGPLLARYSQAGVEKIQTAVHGSARRAVQRLRAIHLGNPTSKLR